MMNMNSIPSLRNLKNETLEFHFLESGDVYNITSKHFQINLLRASILDGMVSNIYLKLLKDGQTYISPLLGVKSPSTFDLSEKQAIYKGVFQGVTYQVQLWLDGHKWSYKVDLEESLDTKAYLYYGQDLAIQSMASVLNSEPYTVQYIDYRVFHEDNGYVLLARQNQGDANLCQISCDHETIGYTTDGFQFFGLDYKKSNQAKALYDEKLVSEIYQYEFSYFALQSAQLDLEEGKQTVIFNGLFLENHAEILEGPLPVPSGEIPKVESNNPVQIKGLLQGASVLNGQSIQEDINHVYPKKTHEEYEENQLLSFFTEEGDHIVLQEKELVVERPHGHVMIHGDIEHASKNVMATSNYMHGVFQSHVVLGNTTFNKLMGDIRNPLHLQKTAGLHIYVEIGDKYYLLNLPSYYEMSLTQTTWFYQLEGETITVASIVDINKNDQYLHIDSSKNRRFLLQYQCIMNDQEYQKEVKIERNGLTFFIPTIEDTMAYHKYPTLSYQLEVAGEARVVDSLSLLGSQNSQGLFFIETAPSTHIETRISGSYEKHSSWNKDLSIKSLKEEGRQYFRNWIGHFSSKEFNKEYSKLNSLSLWYSHNALTHYSSPHGLEQYNGAAWGTRDVCQGPAEFFMASDRYDLIRDILLKTYQRQFIENGDFPQWFMFDEYYQIQAHESHGDIILWPLRLLANYILATDDIAILEETLPYMSLTDNDFTKDQYSLQDHVIKQVEAIQKSFVSGTSLPRYGGGDWDDTLQPVNETLKEKMVSGWTTALLYEVLSLFGQIEDYFDCEIIANRAQLQRQVKQDYEQYLLFKGRPVGFTVFDDSVEHLIYEEDQKTNIQYRLLPYIRSVISSLANEEQAKDYFTVIKDKLLHKDGVRLMNKVVSYKGGKRQFFQRAETAANFGREIGLQYVHAHIRYVQSLFTTGQNEEGLQGLLTVCPITLQEVVSNAKRRQSNMYFSSSDADVKTRYEAEEKFSLLKDGLLDVKGGWRLYSSGPGIYLNQMMDYLVGIKRIHNKLAFLETNVDNEVTLRRGKTQFTIVNKKDNNKLIVNDKVLDQDIEENQYGVKYHYYKKE